MAENSFAPPTLGNLVENFKPHLLRDVSTMYARALVSCSLLHMLPYQKFELQKEGTKLSDKLFFSYRLHVCYLSYTYVADLEQNHSFLRCYVRYFI